MRLDLKMFMNFDKPTDISRALDKSQAYTGGIKKRSLREKDPVDIKNIKLCLASPNTVSHVSRLQPNDGRCRMYYTHHNLMKKTGAIRFIIVNCLT